MILVLTMASFVPESLPSKAQATFIDHQDLIHSNWLSVFYSIVLIYLFLILPFVYFYSEYQTDPILESSFAYSFKRALLYTSVFPLALGVMLTMGA